MAPALLLASDGYRAGRAEAGTARRVRVGEGLARTARPMAFALRVSTDSGFRGRAMRLDFDFRGGAGYAVVHRAFNFTVPANYEFSFRIRGDAPPNTLEFKLIDPSGDNVWWSNQPGFEFPRAWTEVVRKKRQITFAWGPKGGGELTRVAAIEFSITAGTGGKGTVWIDELQLRPREPDRPYALTPSRGRDIGNTRLRALDAALDGDTATSGSGAPTGDHAARRREGSPAKGDRRSGACRLTPFRRSSWTSCGTGSSAG